MDKLLVRGGRRLDGAVAISGAKNAALPQIAASLISDQAVTLTNLPDVTDVATLLDLVRLYGVDIARAGHSVTLNAARAINNEAHYDIVRRMRATVLVLGPLVARFGAARVSMPGGCAIGARPVDLHLKVLAALGASVAVDGGYIIADSRGGPLRGARIVLPSPSIGATMTAMMAATRARGETEILNAAREPEVADLAQCLIAMGARIDGAGTHRISVAGDTTFRPARHDIIPDRIEAGTYAIAAAITGGRLELSSARLEHLAAVCQVLETVGARVLPTDRGLLVERDGPLLSTNITTEPYPGFPTDLQAQFMALMCVADGAAMIRETVFENRFMHVPELARMGADITLSGTSAMVRGVRGLKAAPVMATDLRASVCLILAGLVAEGETTVSRVYHLDRGYEGLDVKLKRCGADIARVKE